MRKTTSELSEISWAIAEQARLTMFRSLDLRYWR